MQNQTQVRHGRLDETPDLATFDVIKFNEGVDPWDGGEFTATGFRLGAERYRQTIEQWGFANLGKIADIGSGFGRWSFFLAEANPEVHGFERNAAGVALSQKLAVHFGFDNLHFHVADVAALPAETASFDGAWCFVTIHAVHREKALSEMQRILKPGGKLFLGQFNAAGRVLAKFFKGYQAGGMSHMRVRNALNALQRGPLFNGKGNYTTREAIEQTLREFGFKLDPGHPIEVDAKTAPSLTGPLVDALQDLPALAERLQKEDAFAADFAQHPELADYYPVSLNVCAIKS